MRETLGTVKVLDSAQAISQDGAALSARVEPILDRHPRGMPFATLRLKYGYHLTDYIIIV